MDLAELEYLAGLPESLALELGGTRVAMFRGSPWDEEQQPVADYDYPCNQREIARVEAIASGCRADYERDRADRLAAEVQRATADTMAAKGAMARLEGELRAMRSRPWWRRIAGRNPLRKRKSADAAKAA